MEFLLEKSSTVIHSVVQCCIVNRKFFKIIDPRSSNFDEKIKTHDIAVTYIETTIRVTVIYII